MAPEFKRFAEIGAALMKLHIDYEKQNNDFMPGINPRPTAENFDLQQSIHSAPLGRVFLGGMLSQGFATLHPGLFSFPPYGRSSAGLWRAKSV
jgi:hypothetical protein